MRKHLFSLFFLLSVLWFLTPSPCHGQSVSVRTNLAWDAVSEPNLGLEFPLGKHVSLGVDGGLKSWPRWLPWDLDNVENTTHWRNFAVVPELRYYFSGVYEGWFVGLDGLYSHFNVGNVTFPLGLYPLVRDSRLQGDLYGGGLLVGKSWWLGARWRLEAQVGAAAGYYNAAQFPCAHCAQQSGTAEGVTIVPKLGINLAWNLRKQQKQEILEIINNK